MARTEPCILTNMCMLRQGDRVLVQDRNDPDWPGITFPGGHVEPGESLVRSVIREVCEETGVHVKNLRYFGTQPWGVDSDLLLGFFADLDGSPEITMDREELSLAGWYHRSELEMPADSASLTNDMIRAFIEERYPR